MNILLITANYAPEIGSSAQIYQDLANGFVKNGHTVHILTSYPRDYTMTDGDKTRQLPLDTEENGVVVHRVRHPSKRDSIIVRGLEHFYIPLYYFRKYKEICRSGNIKFDACIHHIPPLPLYYLARWIKRYDGTPSIFNMQDYHPQELTDVGFMRNPVIISVLKHIERKAYKNADFLAVNSHGGIPYVVSRGADAGKTETIFNPISLDLIDDPTLLGNFKALEDIDGKFLVTYAGILSPFQGIDTILDAAKRLSHRDDILFYIVGDGMERERLEKRVTDENISNVRIHKFLPRREYLNLIKSTDVALISLDERMKAPCLPGKTINLMAMKKAILALVSIDSETADIICKAKCGEVTPPSDVQGICEAVIRMADNVELRAEYGAYGRAYLMENMAQNVVVHQYEDVIKRLNNKNVITKNQVN